MTKKGKYNKKLRYLEYDELENIANNNIPKAMKWTFYLFLFFFFTNFMNGRREFYPTEMISFDAALTFSMLVFIKIVKPLLYNGTIKGYYRRNYKGLRFLLDLYWFLAIGSALRLVVAEGFYIVNTLKINRDALIKAMKYMYFPPVTISVLIISLVLFYLSYFQDKYISIRDFSNTVIDIIRKDGVSKEVAISTVKQMKDIEYGVSSYNGVLYEEDKAETIKKEKDMGDILFDEIKDLSNEKD